MKTNVKEIWKFVPGFEGLYEISNCGNVRSPEKYSFHAGHNKLIKIKPYYFKNNSIGTTGYHYVNFRKNGKQVLKKIHQIVALAFIPNPDNKRTVNHKNGIKTDNRVENLEWNTHSENAKHAIKNGLHKPLAGASHYKAKLTEQQVIAIRQKYKPRVCNCKMLANEFGVNHSTIYYIISKRTWATI